MHTNVFDVLSGKVVTLDNSLLYDIVVILAGMTKGSVTDRVLFDKYFAEKGVSKSDYLAAIKEYVSYQDQGVFQRDTYTYREEARRLEALLKKIKQNHRMKRQNVSLVLNMTHACNLRCHYCTYTGNAYTSGRSHGFKSMPLELAKSSISDHLERTKKNTDSLYISFYGGEPLLEFDSLRVLIRYARNEKRRLGHRASKMGFRIITNGVLLSKDVMMFCIKNRVDLQVSIDGPKNIHDKNRVSLDGCGTFSRVIRNLKMLKKMSAASSCPEYFLKHVHVNATNFFQTNSEMESVRHFFSHSPIFKELFNAEKINLSKAGTDHLKGDYKKKQLQIEGLENQEYPDAVNKWKVRFEEYKAEVKRNLNLYYGVQTKMEQRNEARQFLSSIIQNYIDVLMPAPGKKLNIRAMTGTCPVGDHKNFIDIDGKIYLCTEARLNNTTMIGERVVDFKRIGKMLRSHVLKFGGGCRSCPVFVFCKQCVIHSEDERGMLRYRRNAEECLRTKNRIINKLSFIYSLIEEFPQFEQFVSNKLKKTTRE